MVELFMYNQTTFIVLLLSVLKKIILRFHIGFLYLLLFFVPISLHAQSTLEKLYKPEKFPFYFGVASGDPLHDRVILWTKLQLPLEIDKAIVIWQIATDSSFINIVNEGDSAIFRNNDFTIKVDADKLHSNTWYFYRFIFQDKISPVGRAKTLPEKGETDNFKVAVASCQDYEFGFYNAYKNMAKRSDIDAVIFLGDYIYEGGSYKIRYASEPDKMALRVREHYPTHEVVTLDDYRNRYKQYRLDEDLQEAHRLFPWIVVWDDHEHANNTWRHGAQNHQPEKEGDWEQRLKTSIQVYHEWMPTRIPDENNPMKIYRHFEFGELFNLIMLDTRIIGRDEQVKSKTNLLDSILNSTNRKLLGKEQLQWLDNTIANNKSKWLVMGQQIMMSPLLIHNPLTKNYKIGNADQWDGYPAERQRFYNIIEKHNVKNLVVLTGDIHTAWSSNLPKLNYRTDKKNNTYGVEFVTASITSRNLGKKIPLAHRTIRAINSHIKFVDAYAHGYFTLHITSEEIRCDHIFIDNIKSHEYKEIKGKSFIVKNGEGFLRRARRK
jgi:alkaline phosphatase D